MREITQLLGEPRRSRGLTILCLGAHGDDIEIGCGGTILKLLQLYRNLSFYWVVLSAQGRRVQEAQACAESLLQGAVAKEIVVKDFRDGYFPLVGIGLKDYFEDLKNAVSPDLVFTHCRSDLHQDHRFVSELTWNTFRAHTILEYEVLKYDGDLGNPNLYVALGSGIVSCKIEHVLKYFKSQSHKHWFTEDAFRSLLRIRGVECGASECYAEAFYSRKLLLF